MQVGVGVSVWKEKYPQKGLVEAFEDCLEHMAGSLPGFH